LSDLAKRGEMGRSRKRLNSTAQGFSPGLVGAGKHLESGARRGVCPDRVCRFGGICATDDFNG